MPPSLPPVVFLLGATIFALTTSEFMVAGMVTEMSKAFDVPVPAVGNLVSLYALGMALGGPPVMAALIGLRLPDRPALLGLLAVYVAGGVAAALAPDYRVMAAARVVTGASSAACFGVSLTIAAGMVAPGARGRAASVVLGGLMLAPVLGLPVTTAITQHLGWRSAFWAVALLALLCTALVAALVPSSAAARREAGLRAELASLRNARLWAAYATSGLIIGATFAAFSYAAPILTRVSGFAEGAVPLLLAAYGAANLLGNAVVGRLADRHTMPVLAGGLAALAISLAGFALFAGQGWVALVAFLGVGLCGVPLNPAMVARVMRAAHPGPLVNTLHTSVITAGLALGAWAGGVGIATGYGLTAPLWVGFILAVAGLLSLVPRAVRRRGTA